jgi:DtxR family Mn-dependent transcriptional regulator
MRKKTIEDYVELIYILQRGKERVHTSDIASAFDINPASVTEMFQKLSDENYISYEKYSGVTLTDKGRKIAVQTKQKHDILKNFFTILGVDDHTADADACKIEHSITKSTFEKLTRFVEFVQHNEGKSRWLDHFKYYDATGIYVECNPSNRSECPVHGKKKN